MQRLIMPFEKQMMLCGYKTAEYYKEWGYHHYGVDISTIQGNAGRNPAAYAQGNGEVVTTGFDNSVGNCVIVIYPDCLIHKTGEHYDLVARYCHLASIAVKAGDAVKAYDILGVEGKSQTGDYHLHLEFEKDTKWPLYSPQVSNKDDHLPASKGNILLKAKTDTTVNPSFVMHVGAGQQIVKPTYNPAWLNPEDFVIPALITAPVDTTDYKSLYGTIKPKADKYDQICAIIA
ncbi:MAG TPA: M23 family metallopeptidase [Clostridia bacterium]|nr:M23 family metallopeptidase [Clostridia bacterium]